MLASVAIVGTVTAFCAGVFWPGCSMPEFWSSPTIAAKNPPITRPQCTLASVKCGRRQVVPCSWLTEPSLGNFRLQWTTDWCFLYSATQMASYRLCEDTSLRRSGLMKIYGNRIVVSDRNIRVSNSKGSLRTDWSLPNLFGKSHGTMKFKVGCHLWHPRY